jgi:hypothetical protein
LPRVIHQAVGVGIWRATFVFFYLTRSAQGATVQTAPRALSPEVAA